MAPYPDKQLLFDPSTLGVKKHAPARVRVTPIDIQHRPIDIQQKIERILGDEQAVESVQLLRIQQIADEIASDERKHRARQEALGRIYSNVESVRSQAEAVLKMAGLSVPPETKPTH